MKMLKCQEIGTGKSQVTKTRHYTLGRCAFFVFAFSFAFGCGTFEKKKGDTPAAVTAATSPMPLDGTWTLNCDSSSQKQVLIFSGLNVTKYSYFYADGDTTCSGATASVQTMTLTLTYGQPVANIQGGKNLNLTLISSTMTPTLQSLVEYLNTKGNSDNTDWKLNTPKDITGKGTTPAKGTVNYTLFKIDGGKLYTGDVDTGDETTDAKRPVALDLKNFYNKQ